MKLVFMLEGQKTLVEIQVSERHDNFAVGVLRFRNEKSDTLRWDVEIFAISNYQWL